MSKMETNPMRHYRRAERLLMTIAENKDTIGFDAAQAAVLANAAVAEALLGLLYRFENPDT